MSFLEKEDKKPSTFWDWTVGIGVLLVVGGFTLFYQYQKHSSLRRFHEADSLFQAGKFREASQVYDGLKSAQYLTPVHDSTIYARLDSVESMEDQDKEAVNSLRSKAAAGDTAGIRAALSSTAFHGLLAAGDQSFLDSLKSKY